MNSNLFLNSRKLILTDFTPFLWSNLTKYTLNAWATIRLSLKFSPFSCGFLDLGSYDSIWSAPPPLPGPHVDRLILDSPLWELMLIFHDLFHSTKLNRYWIIEKIIESHCFYQSRNSYRWWRHHFFMIMTLCGLIEIFFSITLHNSAKWILSASNWPISWT